jgi:hypothetical protein
VVERRGDEVTGGVLIPLVHRLRGNETVHVELRTVEG